MATATVLIPVHEREQELRELLESLASQAGPESWEAEVVVINDGASARIDALLATQFPGVKVVGIQQRQGPAHARNAGAKAASGELLLFLDSDGVVAPNWLSNMLKNHDGKTVLLGNVVDYQGDRVQSVPRRATFLGKSLRCRPERANTGPSCNLGVPRALFERLEGFDEEIPYYFEDSDLCIRARVAGARFHFVENAVFRHKGTERKRGRAVRLQEEHSTYAMLKHYRHSFLRKIAFLVLNGAWVIFRMLAWSLRGRFSDAAELLRGFTRGCARYF